MDNLKNKKQSIGSLLIIIYCCVIDILLVLFIPKVLPLLFKLTYHTGILVILILVALGALAMALALPAMKLSKAYLTWPSKPFAVICGLIVGLPITIMLIYHCFINDTYHLDGFTAFMIVASGGIFPIYTTFIAITEPGKLI